MGLCGLWYQSVLLEYLSDLYEKGINAVCMRGVVLFKSVIELIKSARLSRAGVKILSGQRTMFS